MSLEMGLGPMYSNKTPWLVNWLIDCSHVGKCLFVNNLLDTRDKNNVMTKNRIYDVTQLSKEYGIDTTKVRHIKDIAIDVVRRYNYIAIDEAQFFEDIEMVLYLVDDLKKHVRVSGLNGDKDRNVFGNIFRLLPHVDNIVFLKAICSECGRVGKKRDAIFTRLKNKDDTGTQIKIGTDIYEPLCRECYNELNQ